MSSASLGGRLAGLLIRTAPTGQQEKGGQNNSHYHLAQRNALHHFSLLYQPMGVFAIRAQKVHLQS